MNNSFGGNKRSWTISGGIPESGVDTFPRKEVAYKKLQCSFEGSHDEAGECRF